MWAKFINILKSNIKSGFCLPYFSVLLSEKEVAEIVTLKN